MTTLIFIRHAESDFSVHEESIRPLTSAGKKGAEDLVSLLDGQTPDAIYSSPFLRTMDTVRPLAQANQLKILPLDDLQERKVGTWVDDFSAYAKTQWMDFDYHQPGGESLRQTEARMKRALSKILAEQGGNTVFIGCHGTALSVLLHSFFPDFGYDNFVRIKNVMPYVIQLCFQGEKLISMRELTEISE